MAKQIKYGEDARRALQSGIDQLGAHVLDAVLQLDFLRDGDTIIGDERGAVGLINQNVSTLRPQGDLHRVRQLVYASLQFSSGVFAIYQILSHDTYLLIIIYILFSADAGCASPAAGNQSPPPPAAIGRSVRGSVHSTTARMSDCFMMV